MSDYHKLLPKPAQDADDDDGANEFPEVKARPRSTWNQFWNGRLPAVRFAVEIYIALLVTAICYMQVLNLRQPLSSDADALKAQIESRGSYEWRYSANASYESLDPQFDFLWKWPGKTGLAMLAPEPPHDKVPVGVSMFHQLHCLGMIRMGLQSAKAGKELVWDEHMPHCLDYIRKSILCFADDTIELPGLVNGERNDFIDGDGATHMCRSSKTLFDLRGWPMRHVEEAGVGPGA